jgi:ankyrin repeat protein
MWQHEFMKTKLCLLVFILAAMLAHAQTNNLTSLLQQGLLEEQANRNLDAAISNYQSLASQFDQDRQLAATAIFRLGECYRMQGKTNEAALEYQRILRDFAGQQTLATLSRQDLAGMGAVIQPGPQAESQTTVAKSPPDLIASMFDENQEIQRIQTMIQNSPDLINSPDGSGHTPLENAAINGQLKVAAFLLDHGADVNARDGSALFAATGSGNRALVEFLLARGADVNAINNSARQTPLADAVQHGFEAVTEVLLANKAGVNAQDSQGNTPLFIAAQLGKTNIVQMLLTAGADVTTENNEGRTPLSFAAGSGSPETVKALLAAKADPNAGTMDAPLLCTIDKNNPGCAELLLQADANPDVDGLMHCPQGSYGSSWHPEYSAILRSATPLWLAIQKHQLPMVQLLLKYKANPDVAQISEPPAVIFWALSNTNILQALLDAGANPNIKNNGGRTPLSVAADYGSLEAVKLLLAAKADPNAGTCDAPLMCAIDKHDMTSAELLLLAGANPNLKGNAQDLKHNGSNEATPLWMAISLGQLPMVQLLLKFKADPNDSQIDGRSLLFGALLDTNILEALLDAGAEVDARDSTAKTGDNRILNWTPLLRSMENGLPVTTVEILLKHGANPNARDGAFGKTPLHWMAGWDFQQMPDRKVLELLLDYKANPNVRDDAGQTPLHELKQWAAGNNLLPEQKACLAQLADLLRQHGALDVLPDWDRITGSRPSAKYSKAIFYKGTNDWNQFTLFDLLGVQYDLLTASPGGATRVQYVHYSYSADNNLLLFPDLTRIVIHRPAATGTNWNELKINLARALNSGDCSGDVPLRFGDVVEIPEADHVINERWQGLPTNELFTLKSCLTRHLQITVNGQTTNIIVAPQVWALIPGSEEYPLSSLGAKMPPETGLLTAEPFTLWPVLENSKLLLASSDLSRVVVKRRDAATGKLHEWTVDCSDPATPPNFWLRDGDVIAVPEKP